MFLSVCGNRFWRFGEWVGEEGGTWFFVPASGNRFSKYSGKMVPAGRNRPRFAIRAHCGLLVTSVSPNCCLLNGILRKSHFPSQSNRNPWAACLVPLPPSVAGGASNPPCPGFPKLISIPPLASLYKLKYSKLK